MTNTPFPPALDAVDVRHLRYFAVVAEECNLRRAAQRLFMAQPPLSRQIRQLEDRLGVALFGRHSKGLTLTADGAKVLEIIRPLLQLREVTFARLREEIEARGKILRIGFTTAFEQGIFARLEAWLHGRCGDSLRLIRGPSPRLVKEVRKGNLEAALVALPLEAPGVILRETPYAEPLVAAIPATWPEAWPPGQGGVPLKTFGGRRLFWFNREANPAFFDYAKACFALAGFAPRFIEEPAEHDVLLARIASGEGMELFAASFAAIKREGVAFVTLSGKDVPRLGLGLITPIPEGTVPEDILGRLMTPHR